MNGIETTNAKYSTQIGLSFSLRSKKVKIKGKAVIKILEVSPPAKMLNKNQVIVMYNVKCMMYNDVGCGVMYDVECMVYDFLKFQNRKFMSKKPPKVKSQLMGNLKNNTGLSAYL